MELISKDKVLSLARTVYQTGGIPTQIVEVFDIKRLPTIESRPKGMWKHLGETIRAVTLEMHQCSECGYAVLTRTEFNQESYCPHCGADMRGVELYKGDEVRRMIDKEIANMRGEE